MGVAPTYYLSDTDITAGVLEQLATSAPSSLDAAQGWTVDSKAAPNFAVYYPDTTRARTVFVTTEPSAFSAYGYRSVNQITGNFQNSNWVLSFKVKSGATYYAQTGTVRFRLWRSVNANGSSATQITPGWQSSGTISFTAANQVQTGTITWSPGAIKTLSNEYLFLEIEWSCTNSGGNTSAVVYWVHNEGSAEQLAAPILGVPIALSGSAACATTTSAVAVAVSRAISGAGAAASTDATPVLAIARAISGAAANTATVATPALDLLRVLFALAACLIIAATPALNVSRALSGVSAAASTVSTPALPVARALTGTTPGSDWVDGVTKPQHLWPFYQGDYVDRGATGGLDLTAQGSGNTFDRGLVLNGSGFARVSANSDVYDLGSTWSVIIEFSVPDWSSSGTKDTLNCQGINTGYNFFTYSGASSLQCCRLWYSNTFHDYLALNGYPVTPGNGDAVQFVFTYGGGKLNCYVNGQLSTSQACPFTIGVPESTGEGSYLNIGEGYIGYLIGTIKRVGILKDTSWSADDVTAIHNFVPGVEVSVPACVTTTSTPILNFLIAFNGVATTTTTTSTPGLLRAMGLSGVAAATSLTDAPVLAISRSVSGASAARSEVSTPALLRAMAESGAAGAITSTSTPASLITRALSGVASIVSADSTPVELIDRALLGLAAVESQTGAPALIASRGLSGSPETVSTTASPLLGIARAISGISAGQTAVSSPSLDLGGGQIIHLSGEAGAASEMLAPALLLERLLAGAAAGASSILTPSLSVQRLLAAMAVINSETSSPDLNTARAGMVGVGLTPLGVKPLIPDNYSGLAPLGIKQVIL